MLSYPFSIVYYEIEKRKTKDGIYTDLYPAVTINDLISWCDSYDQFAEIFYSRNLQNPTLL